MPQLVAVTVFFFFQNRGHRRRQLGWADGVSAYNICWFAHVLYQVVLTQRFAFLVLILDSNRRSSRASVRTQDKLREKILGADVAARSSPIQADMRELEKQEIGEAGVEAHPAR